MEGKEKVIISIEDRKRYLALQRFYLTVKKALIELERRCQFDKS